MHATCDRRAQDGCEVAAAIVVAGTDVTCSYKSMPHLVRPRRDSELPVLLKASRRPKVSKCRSTVVYRSKVRIEHAFIVTRILFLHTDA